MSSINIQAQACVACEGRPSPENTPCAACGAGQPAASAEPCKTCAGSGCVPHPGNASGVMVSEDCRGGTDAYVSAEPVARLLKELRCFIDCASDECRVGFGELTRTVSAEKFDRLVAAYQAALAALVAAQAQLEKGCKRSHPHENMSPECEALTEAARVANQAARLVDKSPYLQRTAELEKAWGIASQAPTLWAQVSCALDMVHGIPFSDAGLIADQAVQEYGAAAVSESDLREIVGQLMDSTDLINAAHKEAGQ